MSWEPGVTAEQLRGLFNYEPDTGIFTYKLASRAGIRAGSIAGNIGSNGYRRIAIRRRAYLAHRLAWLYVHGEWPARDLDHKNRKRDDNRIGNLRLATNSQNQGNAAWSTNTSGFRGVVRDRYGRRWRALIQVNGKAVHLGTFDTPEQASAVYQKAARAHFGEFFP